MKYDRLQNMSEYVSRKDFVSLDELCAVFEVSKNTVRRDVTELVSQGFIEKVYGGVRTITQYSDVLITFSERARKYAAEKEYIAEIAARHVKDNDVIFIDSGTTTLLMLPHIRQCSNITLLTNNLHVINQCIAYPGLKTIAFGGQLNTKTASFSANYCAMDNLRSFNIMKAFMAATGVSIEKGATNSSLEERTIKASIVQQSDTCFLLADATKFGHSALLTYADLSRFQHVITNRKPPTEYVEYFKSRGTLLAY